jgi:hypothetical protein
MICPLNGSVNATQSPHVLPVGTVSSSQRDMTDTGFQERKLTKETSSVMIAPCHFQIERGFSLHEE